MEHQDDQEHLEHKVNVEKADLVDCLEFLANQDERDHED